MYHNSASVKYILIALFLLNVLKINTVQIFANQEEPLLPLNIFTPLGKNLFYEDLTKTEEIAYDLLIKKHWPFAVNYLAVPWNQILLSVMGNPSQYKIKLNSLFSFKINGGFTVVYNLDTYKHIILPILDAIGIGVVFTSSATSNLRKFKNIKIEPFPYYAVNGVPPAIHKDILYGFIGMNSHAVRKTIFNMSHPKNTIIIQRPFWFCSSGVAEYKDILARSRFSLCPRGKEPGSIRFYESLQAGAIPILISDDWRLPETFDWTRCVVKVKESDTLKIPEIIARISPEQETVMRQACLEAYKQFSGDNFISVIENYYNQRPPQ